MCLLKLDSVLINLINDAKQIDGFASTNFLFENKQLEMCVQITEKELLVSIENNFDHDITSAESFVLCAMIDDKLIDKDLMSFDFLDQSTIEIEMHPDKKYINFKRIIKGG